MIVFNVLKENTDNLVKKMPLFVLEWYVIVKIYLFYNKFHTQVGFKRFYIGMPKSNIL